MPHIVIEHSAGLQDSHDLQSLCDTIWQRFSDHHSVNGPKTVRVRSIAATASRIGVEPQSFAHATVLLLPGRSEEERSALAQITMDALQEALADVGSLTVRLTDLNQPYLKRML
jgi:5-carboxymethyl-2-hydroxymuconate isomerase